MLRQMLRRPLHQQPEPCCTARHAAVAAAAALLKLSKKGKLRKMLQDTNYLLSSLLSKDEQGAAPASVLTIALHMSKKGAAPSNTVQAAARLV